MITEDENTKRWNEYFIPGTDVLKNKLGIINKEELKQKETEITFYKLLQLQNDPISLNFDIDHLKAIHRFLFEDIYPFAGEYRTVYMEKNNSYFAVVDEIEYKLKNIFEVMNVNIGKVRSKYDFACFLADIYVALLNVHPFREGNGRTIREFIREYANSFSKNLPFGEVNFSWSKVDGEAVNSIIDKAVAFHSIIELEFLKALEDVTSEKQKKK